ALSQEKKTLPSNTHQTEHVLSDSIQYQEIRGWGHWKKGRSEKSGPNSLFFFFYTMQRINPLGSTVSITSMLYCRDGLTTHGPPGQ
ncbi:unnamed protein product, partial [Staurois parvus]